MRTGIGGIVCEAVLAVHLPLGPRGDGHLERLQHRHRARRHRIERLPRAVLEQRVVDVVVGLGDARTRTRGHTSERCTARGVCARRSLRGWGSAAGEGEGDDACNHFGDARALDKEPEGLGRHAAPAQPAQRRHARVVPPAYMHMVHMHMRGGA